MTQGKEAPVQISNDCDVTGRPLSLPLRGARAGVLVALRSKVPAATSRVVAEPGTR